MFETNITAAACDRDKLGLTIRIEVSELKAAPAIDRKLSPEESALLKCRDWLTNMPQRDEDLVLTMGETPSGLVPKLLASGSGVILVLNDTSSTSDGSPRIHYAAGFGPDRLGFYSFENRTATVIPVGADMQAACKLELAIEDGPEQRTVLKGSFGGISTDETAAKSGVNFTIGGSPCAYLKAAHMEDVTLSTLDGIVRLKKTSGDEWQINSKTGELRGTTKLDGRSVPCFALERGIVEKTRCQIDNAAATFQQALDPHRPVTSFVLTFVDYDLWRSIYGDSGLDRKAFSAWRKLLTRGALQPLDGAWAEFRANNATIAPITPLTDSDWSKFLSLLMLSSSDSVFARDTWPWKLDRAIAFALVHPDVMDDQIVALVGSSKSGPVCCLCTAGLVESLDCDYAKELAKIGQNRLSVADFRNDYGPLLEHRTLLGQELFAIAGALRTLNAEEVDALCGGLSPDVAKCFRDAATRLRASPDEPLDKLLPQVLDHCWENGLKARIEAALESFATEPKSPEKSTAAASRSTRGRNSQDAANTAQRAVLDFGMARNR